MITDQSPPRAFAVGFKDIDRWDPLSFHGIVWHWPKHVLRPISSVLKARKERVDRNMYSFSELQPMTIHFDGSVDKRKVDAARGYSMELYFARPGDIVVAKIDLKNGAVGIVPHDWENVVVTGHFAVYEPDLNKLVPEYFHLLIQSSFFKEYLWRNKVGAEGRKEVKLVFFERQLIPIPSLQVQQEIVSRWNSAQSTAGSLRFQAEHTESGIKHQFLSALGVEAQPHVRQPRVFAVRWSQSARWSGRATHLRAQSAGLEAGFYPLVTGRDCLDEVKHGCSASPSSAPTMLQVLKLSAVTKGEFDPTEKKFIRNCVQFRTEFALTRGDVLLCRTNGTLANVGMSALVRQDMADLIFPDKLIRVRTGQNMMPEYLWIVLQLRPLRAQIEAAARTAVGNYAIGSQDIWNLSIPLPPADVQRQLVNDVELARAKITKLLSTAERTVWQAKRDIESLIIGAQQLTGV